MPSFLIAVVYEFYENYMLILWDSVDLPYGWRYVYLVMAIKHPLSDSRPGEVAEIRVKRQSIAA